MKRELERKIKAICDEIGTSAAAEACKEYISDLEAEYDKRVAVGMSELDAYRDVLKNIDEIKKVLASLPRSDKESEQDAKKEGVKNLKSILGKVSTVMWLAIVIIYFAFSLTHGGWHLSWLIFLWGSICQTALNMVIKYNKGKSLRRVLKSGLSSIMWQAIVILYFLISFATGMWNISWLIFILGALIQTVLGWIFN